jgi:tetratricopeptide (TPR) repeat protein
MIDPNPEALFNKGLECLSRNEWTAALACFEKATGLRNTPIHNSYLALCIARERGQTQKGIALCNVSIEAEPDNPVHYLNLGRIYQLQGRRLPERVEQRGKRPDSRRAETDRHQAQSPDLFPGEGSPAEQVSGNSYGQAWPALTSADTGKLHGPLHRD